jgi:hypothetical protein
MALADAQDRLVTLLSAATASTARLGVPVDVPPGLSAYVQLGWREDAGLLDSTAQVERRTATLTATVVDAAVVPAGSSPGAVRDELAGVIASVREALREDRTLGGSVALARLARVTVSESWGEGGRLQLVAELEVEVTGYEV